MNTYTFSSGKLSGGIILVKRTLKNGVEIPVLVLGGGRYGRELWVSVSNAPKKPCPARTDYRQNESGSSWNIDDEPKPVPERKVCGLCGTPYSPWVKKDWDNYPGQHLNNTKVRGTAWRAYHPKNQGMVYSRLQHAKTGKTRSGKAKLIGVEPSRNGDAVIVRINTDDGYTRNAFGSWITIQGNPEAVVSTSAPTSSSGRLGTFADGLVKMKPGDVVKISLSSGRKSKPFALYFDAQGQLTVSLFEDWQAGQALEKLHEDTNANIVFGTMPVYSFGYHNCEWCVVMGAETQDISGSRGIKLGPSTTKWRSQHNVVVAVASGLPETVAKAAVAKTGNNFVFVQSDSTERDKVLVRVDTEGLRKGGRTGAVVYRGVPELLIEGTMEHGTANVVAHKDQLWVMAEGDVLRIGQLYEQMKTDYALFVQNGAVKRERFTDWQIADANRNPDFYITEKNLAPWAKVPEEWIGRVVTTIDWYRPYRGEKYLESKLTGELVKTNPVVLNMGWDGQDYSEEELKSKGVFIRLETDKEVRRLEGAELDERQDERKLAESLLKQLNDTRRTAAYKLAESKLKERFDRLVQDAYNFDTMPSGQSYGQGLGDWIDHANGLVADYAAVMPELEDLHCRQEAGGILVDFTAWHRRGGMSNCGDGWVIAADGSHRGRDSDNISRHKSDGDYYWRLVAESELALAWRCGSMRDVAGSSTFEVAKLAVGGCSEAQLQAVAAIEESLEVPPNAFGLNAEAQAEQDALMQEIREAVRQSGLFRELPDLEFLELTGTEGVRVDDDDQVLKGKVGRYANQGTEYPEEVARRAAQLVKFVEVAGGVLEFLVYNKYGQYNMNIRWREYTHEELDHAEALEWLKDQGGDFTFVSGRSFRCSCGRVNRLTKGEMKKYNAGDSVEITCATCGAEGTVQK